MHRINSWAKAHATTRDPQPQSTEPFPKAPDPSIPKTAHLQEPTRDVQVNIPPEAPAETTTPGPEDEKNEKPPMLVRMRNGSGRFYNHTKDAIFHSWVNVLLVFVPAGIAVKAAGLSPDIVFAMNAVAIIPLAGLLSHATESVASRLGDTIGALINVTFGNAVELIIFIIALVKNEIRIVQASLLGSILANLLLILGMAFLLGGLRFQEQIYNSTVTQMSACLLSLSVTSLLLPTAFHASFSDTTAADRQTLKVSRGTSVVLLLVYILYILFQLKSHSYLYASIPQRIIDEESHPGVLADLMNSSSDSSSSDSEDSVDTTTSWSTAKRIKRAMRHRRHRKSSTSSKGTARSVQKKVMVNENQSSLGNSIASNNDSNSCAIDFEEVRYDADDDANPRFRDFGLTMSRVESAHDSDKARKKERKKRRSQRAQKVQAHNEAQAKAEAEASSGAPMKEDPHPSMNGFASAPNFAGMEGAGENDTSRKRSPFGPIPSLLSNTVFSSQSPSNSPHVGTAARPGIQRSNSLPAHMNTVPPAGNAVQFARGAARVPTVVNPVATDTAQEPEPAMSRTAAVVLLLISTALVAVCAEFLVDAIPDMVASSNVSEAFIGLIILPIVGNAAEHVTAVSVATKNKMDLAIGVSVGSSIQIAIFVTPLVVILGWCMDKDMSLYFTLFETICLFVTAFVVNFLVLDGRSNYLEGALLIAAYVIIALASFFYPSDSEASNWAGA
ncbi:Sodium/calcium exchanger membrane region [Penicillium herquei]|nr:Sodium/calcium exchanger membrane region [Penicillium herquei]